VPLSGVRNSYKCLPDVGKVIVSDEPSPPVTLVATITAEGIVIVCATSTTVTSSTILPSELAAGKFVNDKVIDAFVVNV
jgi:hypothetical protein